MHNCPLTSFCLRRAAFIVFLCFATILSISAQSSPTKYHFKEFKLPEINRRALDIKPNLSGALIRNLLSGKDLLSSSSKITQNIGLQYSYFHNSKRKQIFHNLYIGQSYNAINQLSDFHSSFNPRINRQFGSNLYHSAVNRYYFTSRHFSEINWDVQGSFFDRRTLTSAASLITQTNTYFYSISVPLKTGIGRVEPVQDVFSAAFMAEDMLQVGVLDSPMEQEELFELGRVMADARNLRIFDARKKRMYELSQLDNWFKDIGKAKVDNILYYNTMADNWLFAFSGVRYSGRRISTSVTPGFQYFGNEGNAPNTRLSFSGAFLLEQFLPLSRTWQLDYSINAGISRNFVSVDVYSEYRFFTPFMAAQLELGCFPNSRTSIHFNARVAGEFYGAYPSILQTFASFHASGNIFLNYRTRLYADVHWDYYRTSDNAIYQHPRAFLPQAGLRNIDYGANIRLIYSLF